MLVLAFEILCSELPARPCHSKIIITIATIPPGVTFVIHMGYIKILICYYKLLGLAPNTTAFHSMKARVASLVRKSIFRFCLREPLVLDSLLCTAEFQKFMVVVIAFHKG
mmetsp:Transcript_4273/g.7474  ORF Transcript_4273/g.7474 Transcript_4273/m.7474 type:complete len:110 (-) Transcript_4273:365-694(-)